jgi:hypothetical protein
MVKNFNLQPDDMIGVSLKGTVNNYKIDDFIDTIEDIKKFDYDATKPIGAQLWGFGTCMFIHRKTYNKIPSLYQIWYGDDYLAQKSKNIYAIHTNHIKGELSKTIKTFNKKSDVMKRIVLDSKNLIRFNHFKNGKNWSIPNDIIRGA